MSAPTDHLTVQMPQPPAGTVWLLRFNPDTDDATLWLYKRSRITERSNGACVDCASLITPGDRYLGRLTITTASIDQIVEAAVSAAHSLIEEHAAEPAKRAAMEAKAVQVQQRLSIPVEVKRRR